MEPHTKRSMIPEHGSRAGEVSMVERLDEAFQDLGSVGNTRFLI